MTKHFLIEEGRRAATMPRRNGRAPGDASLRRPPSRGSDVVTAAKNGTRSRGRSGSAAAEGREHGLSGDSTIGLLDLDPGLTSHLRGDQHDAAARFRLAVATLATGSETTVLTDRSSVFGAIVLDGMLLEVLRLRDCQETLKLIGPGAPVRIGPKDAEVPLIGTTVRAAIPTRVVLLGDAFLLAAHRWPWIVASLHARTVEQSERVAIQLAISQLPRIEERLMALMWLLADAWGHVTPAGVRLDLPLSHARLGGLVGARRPTVSLALKQLAQRGSLIKQKLGWLILENPAAATGPWPQTPATDLATSSGSSRLVPQRSEQPSERLQFWLEDLARMRSEWACSRT